MIPNSHETASNSGTDSIVEGRPPSPAELYGLATAPMFDEVSIAGLRQVMGWDEPQDPTPEV